MRALVVLPTYNEVNTLGDVTEGLLSAHDGLSMLIVDDASPDGTGRLADGLSREHSRIHVLHRPAKSGLGPAYRAGFVWGLERDYDVLCEMDADGSHDPADIPRLLDTLEGADLVIGSRYVPGGAISGWPLHRLVLSHAGNRYVHALTGLPVADATAGLRAYRRNLLEVADLTSIDSDGYAFQLEMALRAWRLGFRIVEIPITFTERTRGASKISRGIVFEAIWRAARWGVTTSRHPAPPHAASMVSRAP